MRDVAVSTAPQAASTLQLSSHGHLIKSSVTALQQQEAAATASSSVENDGEANQEDSSISSSASGSSSSGGSSSSNAATMRTSTEGALFTNNTTTTATATAAPAATATMATIEALPTRSLLSTSLQQRVDLPRLLRRLNGRHPAAVLPPLLIGHTQVAQNLYPTALQNYLVALRNAKLLHVRTQRRRYGITSTSTSTSTSASSGGGQDEQGAAGVGATRSTEVVEFPEPLLPLCAGTVVLRASMNRRIQDRYKYYISARMHTRTHQLTLTKPSLAIYFEQV